MKGCLTDLFLRGGGGGVMFYSSFCATYSNIVIVLIVNSLQQTEFINITKMN